jgi:hypothetical protein
MPLANSSALSVHGALPAATLACASRIARRISKGVLASTAGPRGAGAGFGFGLTMVGSGDATMDAANSPISASLAMVREINSRGSPLLGGFQLPGLGGSGRRMRLLDGDIGASLNQLFAQFVDKVAITTLGPLQHAKQFLVAHVVRIGHFR